MSDDLIFNGLNGVTGRYLLAATAEQLSAIARSEDIDPGHLNDVKARVQASEPRLGVVADVEDITDLAQTGWGVIFAANANPAIKEALSELLEHRRSQATRKDGTYYQEYRGTRGYYPGEAKKEFLQRRGAPPAGAVNPANMPYYLLIVGDPDSIPYSFQYQLDVQYAVGRLYFNTLEEYAQYARSVITAETANPRPRRATFFGTANPDDRATSLSATALVKPLADRLTEWQRPQDEHRRWDVHTVLAEAAKKTQLRALLGGADTPALLFTAGHGLGFPDGDALQLDYQGALVCQDWPGPQEWQRAIPQDFYYAWDDVGDDARLLGLLAFHFACYSAGTPHLDDYPQWSRPAALGLPLSSPIAPHAFVARLPQRLLGHPKGGALAVVGHVERALGSSFVWRWGGTQQSGVDVYHSMLRQVMRGYPVGAAIEFFNGRYAELSADLSNEIREIKQFGRASDDAELASMWTANADARGFVIFGDPAVRLITSVELSAPERESIIAPVRLLSAQKPQPSLDEVPPPCTATPDRAPVPEAGAASAPVPALTPDDAETGGVTAAADIPLANAPAAPSASSAPPMQASPRGVLAPMIRLEIDPGTGYIAATTVESRLGSPRPSTAEGPTPATDEAFPLFGGSGPSPLDGIRATLVTSLQSFAERLGAAVGNLVADVSSLEVATYVSDDTGAVSYDARTHAFVGPATCRAMTCIRLDGDTLNLVPEAAGTVDDRLWAIHAEMVKQAQASRAELIQAATAAATGLLSALKQL